jgi:hypothetical protein
MLKSFRNQQSSVKIGPANISQLTTLLIAQLLTVTALWPTLLAFTSSVLRLPSLISAQVE